MKSTLVFGLLVLLCTAQIAVVKAKSKPLIANKDYDPTFGEGEGGDADMQRDEYDEYDEDSLDNGDDDDDEAPVIKTEPEKFVVKPHSKVLLPCEIEGNADTYVTMWKKGNSIIFQDTIPLSNFPQSKFLLKNKSLQIEDVDESDNGEYSCEIVMSSNPPRVTHTVLVQYSPKIISLTANRNINEYKPGDTLALTCNATGEPEPKITWSMKGNRYEYTGNTLIIENIGHDHNGVYQCLADNEVNPPAHQSITITVSHKPVVKIEKFTSAIDGDSYNIELRCIVNAIPRAIVIWKKDGVEVKNKIRNKNNAHSITLTGVNSSDFGVYSCRADNQAGSTEQHLRLTNAPSKAIYKTGENRERQVKLVFEVESIYPISEYLLEYKKKADSDWIMEKPDVITGENNIYQLEHTLVNLAPGEYDVKVKSKNSYGWSEESNLIEFTITHKKHHGGQHKQSPKFEHKEAEQHSIEPTEGTLMESSCSSLVPTLLTIVLAATLSFFRH